jgi:PIN domain nuclease of toxin-antitoxin system
MNVVLDASAMIAFLRDEAGAEAVLNLIAVRTAGSQPIR